ncbi:MAG: large conductance mechanosensitive channel protein MscL [Clostridia bacterium]|nr:large conductance mechanosensitive channel protein MscL [Clostridia bacterium]
MKKLFDDFRGFIGQGNVLNLAVGVMIGGAFGKIVSSLVTDIFMPLLGLVTGGIDFSGLFIPLNGIRYASLKEAEAAGAPTLNYGSFLTSILDFLLIALCIFMFVRVVSKLMPQKAAAPQKETRLCEYCRLAIDDAATRCPHCTSTLDARDLSGTLENE